MQNQGPEGAQSSQRQSDRLTRNLTGAAREAYDKTAELGGEAAERARAAAAEAASAAKSQMKSALDRQVGVAASMVGDVARSFHMAADDINRSTPFAGDLVHGLADRMAGYADGLHGRSADDLLRTASDFTRRQPALVFGLAALAGFFMFRTAKHTASSIQAPPIQPSQQSFGEEQSINEAINEDDTLTSVEPRRRTRGRRDDL